MGSHQCADYEYGIAMCSSRQMPVKNLEESKRLQRCRASDIFVLPDHPLRDFLFRVNDDVIFPPAERHVTLLGVARGTVQ